MSNDIPHTSFRVEHGFAVRPDLAIDAGPGNGILMGKVSDHGGYDAVYLGKLAETPYKDVWLDVRGAHVLYVMGKRRSGKSYTLGALTEGLAADGWIKQGSLSQGVLILDTMNVYLTMPFATEETYAEDSEEVRQVRRWHLSAEHPLTTLFHPRGNPPPSSVGSTEVTLRASDLGPEEWCGLFNADQFSDPLGHLITELHGKVSLDGYTEMHGGEHVVPNPAFTIPDLVMALDRGRDFQRYHRDTLESLRRRLSAVQRLPIFSGNGLDVRQLLQPGHVSVLLLRDLDQELRSALVALIVKRVMQLRGVSEAQERMRSVHLARAARFATSDPNRSKFESERAAECAEQAQLGLPRSWIIIDEAHNYVPASGVTPSRKPLKKYVDEGRNLGLSIVVATQNPSALDPSLQRNADMLLIHSLSRHDDIAAAEGMINTGVPSEVVVDARNRFEGTRSFEALVRNLPLGYALASTDRASRLFPVRVRPRITVHGGTEY